MKKVIEAFKAEVRKQVAKGGHSRWGNDESVAVIAELVSVMNSDEELSAEGFDAIRDKVAEVVNPSAFAQRLESLPDGTGFDADGKAEEPNGVDADGKPTHVAHPAWIRRPKKGKRTTSNDF